MFRSRKVWLTTMTFTANHRHARSTACVSTTTATAVRCPLFKRSGHRQRRIVAHGAKHEEHKLLLEKGEASVKSYEAAIIELEGEGDAMQIVELLTEARVLKIQLTRTALEAAIRALAAGGEHARATSMLKSLISEGNEVDPTVLAAVITSLSKTRDSAHFKDMAEVAAGMEVEDSRVSCALARLAARSGEVDDAYVILDKLVSKEQPVDNATFDVVAIELIKAGDERAEEVLEWKEYLAVGLD